MNLDDTLFCWDATGNDLLAQGIGHRMFAETWSY